jgi:hypothetical protein
MKNKIIGGISILVLIAVTLANVNITLSENKQISNLNLENIEAQAGWGEDIWGYLNCPGTGVACGWPQPGNVQYQLMRPF